MVKEIKKSICCDKSVPNVTRRNKTDVTGSGKERNNVTSPPYRGDVCYACPALENLRREVRWYLDGYIARGIVAEGVALARLRRAEKSAGGVA